MAGQAPYEVTVSGTDDETFVFSIPFENQDGTSFPFSDYQIEYAVEGCFTLTQGNGISITDGIVTFSRVNPGFRRGTYQHGCRIRQISSGVMIQVFDGSVIISEGNFR